MYNLINLIVFITVDNKFDFVDDRKKIIDILLKNGYNYSEIIKIYNIILTIAIKELEVSSFIDHVETEIEHFEKSDNYLLTKKEAIEKYIEKFEYKRENYDGLSEEPLPPIDLDNIDLNDNDIYDIISEDDIEFIKSVSHMLLNKNKIVNNILDTIKRSFSKEIYIKNYREISKDLRINKYFKDLPFITYNH